MSLRFRALNLIGSGYGDGDFHHKEGAWVYQSFEGTKWQSMIDESRRLYLKNAYRVILTRSRQGMILFVPKGDAFDRTRPPSFYDGTFEFLHSCRNSDARLKIDIRGYARQFGPLCALARNGRTQTRNLEVGSWAGPLLEMQRNGLTVVHSSRKNPVESIPAAALWLDRL